MTEMYNCFPDKYEELIMHEDYQNNLCTFLKKTIDWTDKSVYEFGAGTGRLTQYYLEEIQKATIYDNSAPMLEFARQKINNTKITISQMDNCQIHTLEKKVDIVIEGWSFGHLITEQQNEAYEWLQYLDSNIKRLAKQNAVIIETMGTNVNVPTVAHSALQVMYSFLKEKQYKKYIIKTDYKFDTYGQAAEIMGSFFDKTMKNDILKRQLSIIQEYTGVWIYTPSIESKARNTKKKYLFNL